MRGVTPDLLFGADTNRNGFIDPSEEGNSQIAEGSGTDPEMNRGWAAYLTLHAKEANVQPDGITPKINLNTNDLQQLHDDLSQVAQFSDDWVNFILAYRLYGGTQPKESTDKKLGMELHRSPFHLAFFQSPKPPGPNPNPKPPVNSKGPPPGVGARGAAGAGGGKGGGRREFGGGGGKSSTANQVSPGDIDLGDLSKLKPKATINSILDLMAHKSASSGP